MMKFFTRILQLFVLCTLMPGILFGALADTCKTTKKMSNLSLPVTLRLPDNLTLLPIGTVLYKKETSLAQMSGVHEVISFACKMQVEKYLFGRMLTHQTGRNTYATTFPGLGIRVTLIYEKTGTPRKEWVLPFSTPVHNISEKVISTEDIKLRLEFIKTGEANQHGDISFRIPSFIKLSDNSLVLNLMLSLLSPKAHCVIQVVNPQIELPPVEISEINNSANNKRSVNVILSCINTKRVSLNIEGVNEPGHPSILKNFASENKANGVGLEMLFNESVLTLGSPIDLFLPKQTTYHLPLSVHYAKNNDKITPGKVKSQVTLRIDYL